MLRDGATIKTTLLTEAFTYADYLRQTGETRLPVFGIDAGGRIAVACSRTGFAPKPGWKILALALAKDGVNGANGTGGVVEIEKRPTLPPQTSAWGTTKGSSRRNRLP